MTFYMLQIYAHLVQMLKDYRLFSKKKNVNMDVVNDTFYRACTHIGNEFNLLIHFIECKNQ